jgi:hypothetical protein
MRLTGNQAGTTSQHLTYAAMELFDAATGTDDRFIKAEARAIAHRLLDLFPDPER